MTSWIANIKLRRGKSDIQCWMIYFQETESRSEQPRITETTFLAIYTKECFQQKWNKKTHKLQTGFGFQGFSRKYSAKTKGFTCLRRLVAFQVLLFLSHVQKTSKIFPRIIFWLCFKLLTEHTILFLLNYLLINALCEQLPATHQTAKLASYWTIIIANK